MAVTDLIWCLACLAVAVRFLLAAGEGEDE
jgi:hypothetical protein